MDRLEIVVRLVSSNYDYFNEEGIHLAFNIADKILAHHEKTKVMYELTEGGIGVTK